MSNVKAQSSNQIQSSNVKSSGFWNLTFICYLNFDIWNFLLRPLPPPPWANSIAYTSFHSRMDRDHSVQPSFHPVEW